MLTENDFRAVHTVFKKWSGKNTTIEGNEYIESALITLHFFFFLVLHYVVYPIIL